MDRERNRNKLGPGTMKMIAPGPSIHSGNQPIVCSVELYRINLPCSGNYVVVRWSIGRITPQQSHGFVDGEWGEGRMGNNNRGPSEIKLQNAWITSRPRSHQMRALEASGQKTYTRNNRPEIILPSDCPSEIWNGHWRVVMMVKTTTISGVFFTRISRRLLVGSCPFRNTL